MGMRKFLSCINCEKIHTKAGQYHFTGWGHMNCRDGLDVYAFNDLFF